MAKFRFLSYIGLMGATSLGCTFGNLKNDLDTANAEIRMYESLLKLQKKSLDLTLSNYEMLEKDYFMLSEKYKLTLTRQETKLKILEDRLDQLDKIFSSINTEKK